MREKWSRASAAPALSEYASQPRKVLRHESLQRRPPDILRPVERPGGTERTEDAGVREVELGMRRGAPARPAAKDRDPEGQQQVFEDLEVALDRLPTDRALPRHLAQVQHPPVREGDRLQETLEAVEVPHQTLRLHLLLHIERGVGGEGSLRVGSVPDEGQQAGRQRPFQIETGTEFRREERLHPAYYRAPRQEIHPRPPQLARARPGQHEARASRRFHDLVDDRQERRNPLDFSDQQVGAGREGRRHFPESFRTRGEAAVFVRRKQVEPYCFRKHLAQPGALARASGPEQEEVALRTPEEFALYRHFARHYGGSTARIRLVGSPGQGHRGTGAPVGRVAHPR